MGSWNGTCGLTRMPIEGGDPVYGMFISMYPWRVALSTPGGTDASGCCDVIDLWQPVSPLFLGEYDTYGAMETYPEDEGPLRAAILGAVGSCICGGAKIASLADNEDGIAAHDETVREGTAAFEALVVLAERDNAFWAPEEGTAAVPIGLWTAHKWAVDALVSQPDLGVELLRLEKLHAADRDAYHTESRNFRYGKFQPGFSTHLLGRKFDFPAQGALVVAAAIARTALLVQAMSRGRIAVHPQAGKGSQSDSVRVQTALAQAILDNARGSFEDGTACRECYEKPCACEN